MRAVLIFCIVFGAVAPNTLFAQNNNRLSIQTGLFHCFFDKTPLLNTNYLNKADKPFNGLFYNSLGIQYQRKINSLSSIGIEYSYFYESYWSVYPNLIKNIVPERQINTFNITYSRFIQLVPKLNFTFGGGTSFRFGSEYVVVNYHYFQNYGFYEPNVEVRLVRDVGVNIRTGIEYSPLKWLTLYTKINLIGFVYMNDHGRIERIRKFYNYKKYPSHFDLSWRFGIGFNFGK